MLQLQKLDPFCILLVAILIVFNRFNQYICVFCSKIILIRPAFTEMGHLYKDKWLRPKIETLAHVFQRVKY